MLPTPINNSQDTVSKEKRNTSVFPNSFQNPFFPSIQIPTPINNSMIKDTPSQPFFYITNSHTINIDLQTIPIPNNVFFSQSLQTDNYRIQIIYYKYNNIKYIVSRYLYIRCRKYNQLDHHISNYPEIITGLNYKPAIKQ